MRTVPPITVIAYCFVCTRTLVGADGAPVRVANGSQREGVCDECRAEVEIYLAPDAPHGAPIVPSATQAPAELAAEGSERHPKGRPGWLVRDKGGKAVGWAATRRLAAALQKAL